MADSILPLNLGSGGKTLDTESLTGAGAVTVERQRLEVAGASLSEIARVQNTVPAGTEYGLVTRAVGPVTVRLTDDTTATGTIAAAAATTALALAGQSAVAIQITGTWVGTLQFEATVDGTNWATVNAVVAGTTTPAPTTTTGGLFRLTPAGVAQVRVNATAWTSGTATITIRASVATGGTFLNQSLLSGTNTIGSVKLTDGTSTVAVKPASAAAVAADPSLVVTMSPNSITFVNDPDASITGTLTAAGQATALVCPGGDSSWLLGLAGTFSAGTSIVFEGTVDGTNWFALNGRQTGIVNTVLANTTSGGAGPYLFRGNTSGLTQFRARCSVFTVADSILVTIRISAGAGGVFLNASIPTGTNAIGTVTAAQATAASLNATVVQGAAGATAWKVDGSAVTQPVSAASLPLPAGAASSANQTTVGSATTKLNDGTNTVAAKAASTAAVATDTALVVAISPNNSVAITASALPLPAGAATSANLTTLGNQTTKLNDGTNTVAVSAAGALKVDGSAVTQPVSGTITAAQATAASLLATVTQGPAAALASAWLTKITDGTNTVAAKAASTAAVATDTALVVAISPNNGVAIIGADTTATGALGALNAAVQVAMAGQAGAGIQLLAGTLVGTITPEVSMDGGTTWVSTFFDDPATSNKVASIVFGSANTATTRTIVGAGGASHLRVRVSAFTSGTATANLRASATNDPSTIAGGAPGATAPPVALQVGGTDGTLLRALTVKAPSAAAVATDPSLVVSFSPNSPLPVATTVATSPIGAVSLGNTLGKANVMKTGVLATVATTVDQVILTYTVTTAKTFYLEYLKWQARLTTYAATATLFGAISLELPSGTKVITEEVFNVGADGCVVFPFPEPIAVAAGVVIRVVCTPSAVTAFTWRASFGGYEK